LLYSLKYINLQKIGKSLLYCPGISKLQQYIYVLTVNGYWLIVNRNSELLLTTGTSHWDKLPLTINY